MCGIAGMMSPDGAAPDLQLLEAMAQAIGHRGPDGSGQHSAGSVALAHLRLAIIDLETGDQPLYADNGVALIGNGEIYNYIEIRERLGEDRFRTRSDCESALQLYLQHGEAFADELRGMYALAIHDPSEERLILARDSFGIKPLYYVEDTRGFAFASEPQALLAAGFAQANLNTEPLDELLQLQFTTGRETIYPGIERVLPGETLTVSSGRIVSRRHRPALPTSAPATINEAEALVMLDRTLEESVDLHQRSDVPYAMFLSGGVDSSVLLALMARLNDTPVTAFTAGFPDTGVHDERALARKLAQVTGAEHHEIEFSETDFWALLPEVAAVLDDPAADYAVLPTYKLARAAHEHGLKVVLSGEGGDELFAGYGRYRDAVRPWWSGGPRAMRRHGRFDGMGILRRDTPAWRDGIHAAESQCKRGDLSPLQRAQAVDCADWLPNDLLIKLDRCLMAHSVEGRTPFLDPKVAAFAFRLPDHLKVRRGRGKYLLRRWLEQHLPEAEPFGRKRGFTVPVGEWIAARGGKLGPLVARQPGVAALAHPEQVEKLFRRSGKREGFAAWALLFYALWHRRHILGMPPTGDVFETLATAA
jgi:asparagine synthase (glutamine-hydrolysing)